MTETFDFAFQRGCEAFQKNDLKIALFNFSKCIELEPNRYESYVNRGLIFYTIDEYDKAIADLKRAISIEPTSIDGYYNLGLCYQQIGEYTLALENFHFVKKNSSNNNVQAEIEKTEHLISNPFSFTLEQFSRMTTDNNDPEVAFNGAKFYFEQNNYVKAIESLNNAIKYKDDYFEAYLLRGVCYAKLQQFDKAIQQYTIAEKYTRDKDVVYSNLGNLYAQMGNFEMSLEYLNKAIDFNPYVSIHYRFRGQTNGNFKLFDAAIYDFTKAIELDPGDLISYSQRATILFNTGKYQVAKLDLLYLTEHEPENSLHSFILGIVFLQLGEKQKAFEYLTRSKNLGNQEASNFIKQNF